MLLTTLAAFITAAAGRTSGETAQYTLQACINLSGPSLITTSVFYVAKAADQNDYYRRLKFEKYITSVAALMDALRAEIVLKTASISWLSRPCGSCGALPAPRLLGENNQNHAPLVSAR